jgi:fanconi-associated nuclease 1
MIFALVFWDIIFADIPGAFETSYQTAPLDLAEETFYYARKEMIDIRLEEIRQGQAREILEKHDDAYREKDTWCVGVQWDICTKQDLVEIVEVSIMLLGSHHLEADISEMQVPWWRIALHYLQAIL